MFRNEQVHRPLTTAANLAFRGINLRGLAVALSLLGLWQLLVSTGVLSFVFLPSPWQIARHAREMITTTDFFDNLGHTLGVTMLGWVIASAIGIVLGGLVGLVPTIRVLFMASIDVLRALPAIALIPAAFLVLGLSSQAELLVVVYAATWPVLVTTAQGVSNVPMLLTDVGRTLRMRRLAYFRKIVFPGALGPVLVGLRLSLTVSLVLAVVVEMVGNPVGLGHQLVIEQQALQPDLMFGYIFTIGVIAVVLNWAFLALVRIGWPGHVKSADRL